MKVTQKPIGILGGTFDPIHLGHLHVAESVLRQTPLAKIKFLPCYQPVHRCLPEASVTDRMAMIKLALQNKSQFAIDKRELERKTPSFMIDTLISLREDYPKTPLGLIIGIDAYQNIITWKRWNELLDYAHLVVTSRPAFEFKVHPHNFLEKYEQDDPSNLSNYLAGTILFVEIAPCTISASEIREKIKNHKDISALVPASVEEYIKKHHLYQPL